MTLLSIARQLVNLPAPTHNARPDAFVLLEHRIYQLARLTRRLRRAERALEDAVEAAIAASHDAREREH